MSAFVTLDWPQGFHSENSEWTALKLAQPMPIFAAETSCADVFEWFNEHPAQVAAAIVDSGERVIGLVNRLRFLATYAQRYFPELYGKKPITKLANVNPLVVDEGLPLADLAAKLAIDFPDALRECFVVTRDGRYTGIGTCESLVRCKIEMLAARETQLREALLSAQDANQTKSNFLALMSHELRTPLNAIIGFSEVLSSELFGPHGVPRYRDYAFDIHGAGSHLLALIKDILDLSKSEAGKLELTLEPIDLAQMFRDCLKLVVARGNEQNLRMATTVAPDMPHLMADRLRLKQILLNLMSNAIKFTPSGGRVEAVTELTEDGGIRVVIHDTGIGMAAEQIPTALEPFRQIASPLSRKVEGTGLGLSLAKSLTERHGGTLAIRSALNQGTSVELRFPPRLTAKMGEPRRELHSA